MCHGSSRMLKKSASGILDIREASFVSGFGRFTNDEDGLFEHPATILTAAPEGRLHGVLCINRVFPQPASEPVRT
jgi:hypothetical protein